MPLRAPVLLLPSRPSFPPFPRPALNPQPYFNLTWRNPEHVAKWANGTWVYTRRFDPLEPCLKLDNANDTAAGTSGSGSSNGSSSGSGSGSSSRPSCDVFLVFDGVKMGARIALNGHVLGEITDQFLRYRYSVGHLLHFNPNGNNNNNGNTDHAKTNTLTVTFDRTIDTGGRFMACTGGYDWGPWSTTWKTSKSVDAVNNSYDARYTAKGYVRGGGRGDTLYYKCFLLSIT